MKIRVSGIFLLLPLLGFGQFTGSVTQGLGTTTIANLMPNCPSNHISPLGSITSSDNKVWIVPAETRILTGPYAFDLHNVCNNKTPANLAAADLIQVPITEIDAGGELITGFLFSDNYFELYVNGILVGADPVPFTPFNSCVVKFRVSRPYTLAVKLVDWEENPGLGSEIQGANNYHPGDGGFIAQFSDGTVTNGNWKAQTFYIAPIQDLNAIAELPDGTRSSAAATLSPTCNANCYGIHYEEPLDWKNENFNDSGWPIAKLYTAAQVTNQAAYTNFANTAWNNASFIWSSNLILDNLVLARYTVQDVTAAKDGFSSRARVWYQPESGLLQWESAGSNEPEPEIRIFSLEGKEQFCRPGGEHSLNLRHLSPGIYMVKIQTGAYPVIHKILIT
jgi:hypothetical protein